MKILKVCVKRMVDTDPDTSYLGYYSSKPPKDSELYVDRKAQGDWSRNEMEYFFPTSNELTSALEAYHRAESPNEGMWWYLGITAYADIQVSKGSVIQTISSGGLWGIESDSDESYFGEVICDELTELRSELESLGFTVEQIDDAFCKYEVIDE